MAYSVRKGRPPQCPVGFCRWKEKARKDGIICGMQETINDERTLAGGGKDMFLAGCYYILRNQCNVLV